GRCWLSFCVEQERIEIFERLRRSSSGYDRPAHNEEYCQQLTETVRSHGYATRIRGYHSSYARVGNRKMAMAVPVFASQHLIACLNVVWDTRFAPPNEFTAKWLGDLQDAATRLGLRVEEGI